MTGHPASADGVRDALRVVDLLRAGDLMRALDETRSRRQQWHLRHGTGRDELAELEAALDAQPNTEAHERGRLEQAYAVALLAAGRADSAAAALRRAADGYSDAGDVVVGARVLIDGVTLLHLAGHPHAAASLACAAEAAVDETDDHAAVSELALLAAWRAADEGDLPAARRHATRAGMEALAGRSAGGYAAATIAQAELAEAAGDRVGAYAALTGGALTLRVLAGAGPASAAIEPRLVAARKRWGSDGFAAVRDCYVAGRAGRRPVALTA